MSICLNPVHDIVIACRIRNMMDPGSDNLEFFYKYINGYNRLIDLLYVKDADVLKTAVFFMKRMYPNVEDIAREHIMLIERMEIGLALPDDADAEQRRIMSNIARDVFRSLRTYRFECVEDFLSQLTYEGVYKEVHFSPEMMQMAATTLVDYLADKHKEKFFTEDAVRDVLLEIRKSGEPSVRKGLLEGFQRAYDRNGVTGFYASLRNETGFADALMHVAKNDVNEEVRKLAIDYMFYCGGEEITRLLVELVGSGSEKSPLAQKAAIEALLYRRDEAAVKYFEEDIFVAKQDIIPLKLILEQMVSYRSEAFVRYLLVKLKDTDTEVEDKENICKILDDMEWKDLHTVGVLWDASIRDPSWKVRSKAFAVVSKRLGGGNIKDLLLKDKPLVLSGA